MRRGGRKFLKGVENKLISIFFFLISILLISAFNGVTLGSAVAQTITPEYVTQIAEQYKGVNEFYRIIETNNGVDKGYYVIIYYNMSQTAVKEITGSIIVDMVSQKPLNPNELITSDLDKILKFSSLVWHYDLDSEKSLAKGNLFYNLSNDMYNGAEDIKRWIADGSIINIIDILGIPVTSAHPFILGLKIYDKKSLIDDTYQIIDIQSHMLNIENNYRTMSTNYDELGYSWYRISEGKYEYADKVIPESSGLDQINLKLYMDILEDLKYIASQDVTAYFIGWYVATPEEIEHINQLKMHFSDLKSSLEEISVKILSDYDSLKSNYRYNSQTTPGFLIETHTCDSIAVETTYFQDSDNDGYASLYYKQSSSSSWINYGYMTKDIAAKIYTKTISGLSENTNYDIKVDFSDPDSVDTRNPLYAYSINTGGCKVPPGTPTISDLGASDDGVYQVAWSSDIKATYYQLKETIGSTSWTYQTTSNSKSFTGKGDGTYYYQVMACNPYGCSGWSNTKSITVKRNLNVPPNDYQVDLRDSITTNNEMPYSFNFIAEGHISVNDWHMKDYDGDGKEEYYLLVGEKFWQWFYAKSQDTNGYTVIGFGDTTERPNIWCVEDYVNDKWNRDQAYCDSRKEYSWTSKILTQEQERIKSIPMWAYVSYDIGGYWEWNWGWDSSDLCCTPDGEYYHVKAVDPSFLISASPNIQNLVANSVTYTINLTKQGDFTTPIDLSCSGLPSGTSCSFSSNQISPSAMATMTVQKSGSVKSGKYVVNIKGSGGGEIKETSIILDVPNNPPNQPSIPSPSNDAKDQPNNLTLSWVGDDPDGDPVTYRTYLDINPDPNIQECYGGEESCSITSLNYNTTYYWKVVASDGKASPVTGPAWSFKTQPPPTYTVTVTVSNPLSSISTNVYVDGVNQGSISSGETKTLMFNVGTTHSVSVDRHISSSTGIQYVVTNSPQSISETAALTFNYNTQYYLTINTDPPGVTSISGSGWYDSGTTQNTGSALGIVGSYTFSTWKVDNNSVTGNPISVLMNAPHTVIALYTPSTAPVITTHPSSQAINEGQTATFNVTATSTTPMTYQWQKNDTDIQGAIASTYTTPMTTRSDNGTTFRVIVSNAAGSATSNTVTLTVISSSIAEKKLTQLTTDPAKEWYPAWSPDGNEIVFNRFANPSKLIKLTLADSSELQLATHGWINGNPCIFGEPSYSPDGFKIAYGKDGCNGWVDIFVVNSNGTSDQCLTCGDSGENVEPAWSPLSKKILYKNSANCCNLYPWTIFSINPDGSGKTSLGIAEYLVSYGALSADESKIVYIQAGNRDSLPWELKIKDLNTNTVKVLETCNPYKCFLTRQSQSWQSQVFSPDNNKIIYTSYEKGNSDIYTINIDGIGKTNLTSDTSDEGTASFSPDGSKIVYVSNKAGNNDIWIMDTDGNNKVQLTTDLGDDNSPSWSPDGSRILFVSDRSGNYDLWIMELAPLSSLPPVADCGLDKITCENVGSKVQFNGSTSYDPDGSIISYYWEFGDGTNRTGIMPDHTYSTYKWNGSGYEPLKVNLTVKDDNGFANTTSSNVTIWIAGDANGDGNVNILDASLIGLKWGSSDPCADLNNDGIVNILDASIIGLNWGKVA